MIIFRGDDHVIDPIRARIFMLQETGKAMTKPHIVLNSDGSCTVKDQRGSWWGLWHLRDYWNGILQGHYLEHKR